MNESKRCARCGAAFACGRRAGRCWCQALPPLPARALDVAADCLCPACLEHAVAATRPSSPDDAGTDPDPAA